MLDLTPDERFSTTRAVRKRLDVERPVPDELAFTVGTDFEPAARPDTDTIIHWDTW